MNTIEVVAQILGMVTVVLGFLAYQVKTDKQLLVVNLLDCGVFAAHFFLLGAISGGVLNTVGVLRSFVYYHKDKSFYRPKLFPVLFAVLMLVLGIWSSVMAGEGFYAVFVIAGLVINTLCLSLKDPQKIRISVLFTCPMVLIYDIIVHSVGGAIYESVAIVSAIIGLIRYRQKKTV
ncbi:MAG: YgjV family protein [Clostridia bacterium]|nr:YgjV family protein [Clostridia bacterium]